MSRLSKRLLAVAVSLAGLVVVLAIAGWIVVHTAWFHQFVRDKMVAAIETATGGRSEIGGYALAWPHVTVNNFVLHGTEPADSAPLFQAQSITATLKIISIFEKKVDLEAVDVKQPRIHLIVHEDGSTNIPAPKIKRASSKGTLETIVDLKVGNFSLENGLLLLREEKTPFDLRGENLRVNLAYNAQTPGYAGEVAVDPLYFALGSRHPSPFSADIAVAIDRSRIHFDTKKLALAKSTFQATGDITNLSHAEVRFRYRANVDLAEIQRFLELDLKPRGLAQVSGNAFYAGSSNFWFEGDLHASQFAVDLGAFHVRDTRLVSAMRLEPALLRLNKVRLSTSVNPPSAPAGRMLHVDAEIGAADLGIKTLNLDLRSVALATLGGTFAGAAQFRKFETFRTQGTIAGFDARTLLGIYSPQTVPWDGLISGSVQVDGSLRGAGDIDAAAQVTISPAPASEPVHGTVDAHYVSRTGTLDLGDSTLSLPATSVRFTGVLGRQLRVSVDSKNLDEILSAAGIATTGPNAVPIHLHNGEAIFTGTVSGELKEPQIAGHAAATNFVYDQRNFDSFAADVAVSPAGIQLKNASLAKGALHAQFQGSVGLADWKSSDASPITGTASIANAGLSDLLALADRKNVPVSGTLKASAQVSGSIGAPVVAADLDLAKGQIEGEPFDRLAAKLSVNGNTIQVADGRLTAGARQITASATYQHAAGDFQNGSAQFQVATNAMPIDQFRLVAKDRPEAKGTVQLSASGSANVSSKPSSNAAKPPVQISALHADVVAHGLALGDQMLGDAHLTATTEGQAIVAHLDSDFANSTIAGDGRWQLADNYPGSASIKFSNLDFARLRDWLAPAQSSPGTKLTGSAQGSVTIEGPALDPAAWKASLTIPQFQLQPAPGALPKANLAALTVRNLQPIQITLQNDVVRVASAHFAASQTDITIGGTVSPRQKNQLDLQVNGTINLALLQTFDPDAVSSGQVQTDANVRGTLHDPQFAGKLQLSHAALNYSDFPNGISNAQGSIVFSGTRATIQTLTAETGGGKVAISGFASYSANGFVFRIQADATSVRVRYPEGVSTVANTALTLTGSSAGSLLAGTITIERLGFNPHTDLASVLAKSSEPERAPSAQTGLLADMQLDIQIGMAPDVTFQSTLAQNIQAEANLRVRGTALSPAVLGRIVVTQGQIAFFGTKFTIDQGSISFYNPVKIEPVLDIDFETKARGVDVILTVSGPISKLNLTPRSDPPLQFSEIIALLATGNAPISDPNLAIQQPSTPTQSFQQIGASALLGQALANPVAGRLQRFFGVTKLRIDPSLQGVENNPQARITIEQQVTPDITFTYITNITNSNPEVVRVEWAFNKRWSVVALREENGLFGIDFLYKKRFK